MVDDAPDPHDSRENPKLSLAQPPWWERANPGLVVMLGLIAFALLLIAGALLEIVFSGCGR
jgi:hypothetical protein